MDDLKQKLSPIRSSSPISSSDTRHVTLSEPLEDSIKDLTSRITDTPFYLGKGSKEAIFLQENVVKEIKLNTVKSTLIDRFAIETIKNIDLINMMDFSTSKGNAQILNHEELTVIETLIEQIDNHIMNLSTKKSDRITLNNKLSELRTQLIPCLISSFTRREERSVRKPRSGYISDAATM